MCGLIAVINKNSNGFTREQQDVFSTLLFVDYLRGPDSTGIFSVSNRGDVSMAKEASNPIEFMKTKEYDQHMSKVFQNGSAIVGHNRKATRGTVNDVNAHPFVVDDNIVLVHNGTLWGDHKKLADVEVDSHAIAHTIHEKGTVTEALSAFDGAYALIWFDVKNGTLNLIRNSQRPLWWMEIGSAWVWSSEKCMLEFVATRHNLTVKQGPTELPEEVLQQYTLKNRGWELSDEKLKIVKKTYTPVHQINPPYQQQFPKRYHNGRRIDLSETWGDAYGSHDYVFGVEHDDADDVPFKDRTPPGALPHPISTSPEAELYSYPTIQGTTPFFEKELARKNNKVVTNEQFHKEVLSTYYHGTTVIAETFDYCYANQRDDSGGFYLYSHVIEDPDIIVRHLFERKNMDEQRMVTIASNGYIYEFTIDKKKWTAFTPGQVLALTAGYVMMYSDRAILKFGGGVGDLKYANLTKRDKYIQ